MTDKRLVDVSKVTRDDVNEMFKKYVGRPVCPSVLTDILLEVLNSLPQETEKDNEVSP